MNVLRFELWFDFSYLLWACILLLRGLISVAIRFILAFMEHPLEECKSVADVFLSQTVLPKISISKSY